MFDPPPCRLWVEWRGEGGSQRLVRGSSSAIATLARPVLASGVHVGALQLPFRCRLSPSGLKSILRAFLRNWFPMVLPGILLPCRCSTPWRVCRAGRRSGDSIPSERGLVGFLPVKAPKNAKPRNLANAGCMPELVTMSNELAK